MAYKFNNGNGAVICDVCNIMTCDYIYPEEYEEAHDALGYLVDVCEKCFNKIEKEKEHD